MTGYVIEAGNGLPTVGDLVVDYDTQDVYRITSCGSIETQQWEANRMRVDIERVGSMWDEDEGSETYEGEEISSCHLAIATPGDGGDA